jgi:hypothetical protein
LVDSQGVHKNGIEHTRDKMVGRGVLLDVARAKGIRTFRAFVSGQNVAVRRLIAAAGLDVVTRGDMLEASLPDLAASAE